MRSILIRLLILVTISAITGCSLAPAPKPLFTRPLPFDIGIAYVDGVDQPSARAKFDRAARFLSEDLNLAPVVVAESKIDRFAYHLDWRESLRECRTKFLKQVPGFSGLVYCLFPSSLSSAGTKMVGPQGGYLYADGGIAGSNINGPFPDKQIVHEILHSRGAINHSTGVLSMDAYLIGFATGTSDETRLELCTFQVAAGRVGREECRA